MGNGTPNRFEWLKAVMQSEDVNTSAKLIASAMAVQYANDMTGQLNPSMDTLASYLKTSSDTVKRGVKALVSAGWLDRTEGRGRGNTTTYFLASPGQIISISRGKKGANLHQKKGSKTAPSSSEKGANLHGKGGKSAPSYIEQSSEQKTSARTLFANHRFLGSATDGPIPIKADRWEVLNPWAEWLSVNALPKLCELNIGGSDRSGKFYFLPYKSPPLDAEKSEEAKWYFNEMLSHREVIHAAQ